MGCKQSTGVNSAGNAAGHGKTTGKSKSGLQKGTSSAAAVARPPPKYMTADPDLGWRNVTDFVNGFPVGGFLMDFQNERSGHTCKRINVIDLSLNIAERASRLANQFGVAITENDWQSSSNLLNSLAGFDKSDVPGSEWDLSLDTYMNKLLKHFGCPKFGWKLKARVYCTKTLLKTSPNIFLSTEAEEDNNQGGSSSAAKAVLAELAAVPEYLQLVEDKNHNEFLLDIGEIAMNIAEQLLRLEKSENRADDQPVGTKTFGWKRIEDNMMPSAPSGPNCSREQFKVPVVNIDGEAFVMCPEELVMNVASWVQETYLTAPAF